MADGQKEIYYISGEKLDSLRNSPQLEGFRSRGIEVILFTDTVDEFWLQQITQFKDFTFKSVTKGNIDLDNLKADDKAEDKTDEQKEEERKEEYRTFAALKDVLHEELNGEISFVRLSKRLTESPVCLVADEKGVDMHMEKVLKIHQKYEPNAKPILEINPNHALVKKLASMADDKDNNLETLKDSAHLLLDQAVIIQGETPSDPAGFARRMSQFMEKGLLG